MNKQLLKKIRIRKKSLQKSDEGVATTVGTIMALLVFLSILSLITQQYVPVWMEDKEAYHMDEVMGDFSDLKGKIDNLIMNSYTDYPMYSSFRLGSEGIPLFASQTPGIMRLDQNSGEINLNFIDGERTVNFNGGGNLSLEVMNRYFEEQTVIFENGAILLEQNREAIVRSPAPISIERDGDSYSISFVITDIVGEDTRIGGVGNVGVISELWSSNRHSYSNPKNVTLEINSVYSTAWNRWFSNELDNNDEEIIIQNGNSIILDLEDKNVNDLTVIYSTINMEIST